MDLLPAILLGYVIGSLPLGYLLAHRVTGIDLRHAGSGNVGAANVYRTSGLLIAIAVMLADMAKGAGAVLAMGAVGPAAVASGVAAVFGHVYPVWLGFRGGKGVATASGVFAVLAPVATLIAAVIFVLTVARTRFISLGSIVATALLPAIQWAVSGSRAVAIGATVVAVLILFRHRGNMARLRSRTERAIGA